MLPSRPASMPSTQRARCSSGLAACRRPPDRVLDVRPVASARRSSQPTWCLLSGPVVEDSPVDSGPAWTSTSTRARSSSPASGSPSRRAASPRRPRRRARRRRSSAVRSSSRRRCHVGGRGKAGGIKLAATPAEAEEHARARSSGWTSAATRPPALDREGLRDREGVLPLGHVRPRREEAAVHADDRGRDRHRGGRRDDSPEKLARLHVDPLVGFQPFQARWLCFTAGHRATRTSRSRSSRSSASSTRRSSRRRRCSARSTR